MAKNTNVVCDVENCLHNCNQLCSLEKLNISCTCSGTDCHEKRDTICKSFCKKEEK